MFCLNSLPVLAEYDALLDQIALTDTVECVSSLQNETNELNGVIGLNGRVLEIS